MEYTRATVKCALLLIMLHTVCCDTNHDEAHSDEEPKHIHTVHHHHIQKYTVYKKIEVPVIKEVKVPYYVYEPIKFPYHYIVKPYIVKVPIEYHNEEKHEDVHHPHEEKHSEESSGEEHHEEGHDEGISEGYDHKE